jgi:O-antigen/teichoic acid export membrane protein
MNSIFSKPLFKNSLVYIITDGINRAIPFLLLPFLTYYLTTEDYGVITNFNVLIQILSVFYFAASGAIPVMYYKLDKEKFKVYSSNLIILNTVIIFAVLGGISVFNNLMYRTLGFPFQFQLYAILIVFASSITYINMLLWRCEEKAFTFGKYQISQSFLSVSLTILFVIVLLLGWQGRVYVYLISAVIFGIISFFILYKKGYWSFKISKEYQKHILLFAIPLVPHALAIWVKSGADKILLTSMCGMSENGLYSTAMTLGSIVTMIIASFSNAFSPYLYKKLHRFDNGEGNFSEKKQLVKLTYLIIASVCLLVVIIYFISIYIINYLYSKSYTDSVKFLPYIMISQFFYGCYVMFVSYCHYTFKTKILGIITFSIALMQILLSYLLIRWIDSTGSAVSSAIASFFTFILVAIYAMKVYKLPWFSSLSFVKNGTV